MSLEEDYFEHGHFDFERHPLAYQVDQVLREHEGTDEDVVRGMINSLVRAVAVLEDEITKLRGSRPHLEDFDIRATSAEWPPTTSSPDLGDDVK